MAGAFAVKIDSPASAQLPQPVAQRSGPRLQCKYLADFRAAPVAGAR